MTISHAFYHKGGEGVKDHETKSRMFFAIIAVSIIIFNFAYVAFLNDINRKEKDILYFSDEYFLLELPEGNMDIGELLEKINSDNIKDIAFIDMTSGYKFVSFTDSFYKQIGVDKKDYLDVGNDNVVFVSESNKNQCYIRNGMYKINIFGKEYDVKDFFIDDEGDTFTTCYINVYALNAKDNSIYNDLAIDVNTKSKESVIESIGKEISGAKSIEWSGKVQGLTYTLDLYFYTILMCGIVLCINCTSFANMWVKSYQSELFVRKLVGINNTRNLIFVVKEFGKLFLWACISGVVGTKILFIVFKMKKLSYVRGIFGTELNGLSVLLATCSVFFITISVIISRYYFMKKNTIMSGVRSL